MGGENFYTMTAFPYLHESTLIISCSEMEKNKMRNILIKFIRDRIKIEKPQTKDIDYRQSENLGQP